MTNTISNSDNSIDSRDIIARIEELEGSKVQQWVAGWNMAGYMPDAEPCTFDNFEDARDYVAEVLETLAYDASEPEGNPEEAKQYKLCADQVRETSEEFSFTELRRAFWVKREANILEDEDEAKELAALLSVQEQAEGYASDWRYGVQLIRDDYFNQAMDELIDDIGDIPKDLPSYMTITLDYDALQSDYTSVDFDGVTYWVR